MIRQFQSKELFYGFSYLDFAESQINFYFIKPPTSCPIILQWWVVTYACPSDCVLIHSYVGKRPVCKEVL